MALSVKEWRRARGLTQQNMADRLNIHVNTWIRWEEAAEYIPISKAFEIAGIYEVTIDEIIFCASDTTKCDN